MSPMNNTYPEGMTEEFVRVNTATGEIVGAEEGSPRPDPIRFKIFKHFGVIGKSYQNREIELNLVSWNDGFAKYDIRAWDRIHEHMSKGITLRKEEAIRLRDILNTVDFEKYGPKKAVVPEASSGAAEIAPETEGTALEESGTAGTASDAAESENEPGETVPEAQETAWAAEAEPETVETGPEEMRPAENAVDNAA